MGPIKRVLYIVAIVISSVFVWFAEPLPAQMLLAGSTPEDGAVLDGAVRTVRVWFDQKPQVSRSSLEIDGPGNRARIEGLHTMGENDLMGRVTGPMPDGEWTMTWTTIGIDGEERSGNVTFTVQRQR